MSFSATVSAITVSSNIKVNNVQVRKLSDSYKVRLKKMSVILTRFTWIIFLDRASTYQQFQLRRSWLLSNLHIDKGSWLSSRLCPPKSSAKLLNITFNMIYGSISRYLIDVNQPLPIFWFFDLWCVVSNKSVWPRYHCQNTYWPLILNRITLYIWRNPLHPAPSHIVKF
jgi:hypothetical protein